MDENTILILIMGLSYALIEAAQLLYVAFQAKRTADALDRLTKDEKVAGEILKNGFVGMAKMLRQDKEAQQVFFDFVQVVGSVGYQAAVTGAQEKIKGVISKEMPVPKKYRWLYDLGGKFLGEKSDTGTQNQPINHQPGGLSPL